MFAQLLQTLIQFVKTPTLHLILTNNPSEGLNRKNVISFIQSPPLFQSDPWPRCHNRSKTFWSSTGPEPSEQGPAEPGRWYQPPSDTNNDNIYFPRMSSVKTVRIRPAQMMKEKIIEIIFPVLWILLKFFSPTKGKIERRPGPIIVVLISPLV